MNEPHLLEALAARGPDYRPRTRHLLPSGRPRYTNHLISETSPYLLQHAHNPVDWRPWGDEAFAEARRRDVPVFLSVGYSTCHWCHVMEHESFEDEEIAAALNQHFVPVKVDREERPDVDAVFMEFLQLTSGGGGWPMSVFLTPDRRPLFAGTYFPARDGDRGPHHGFLTILRAIASNWRDPRFQAQADRVLDAMQQPAEVGGDVPGPGALSRGASLFRQQYDPRWGGFGGAPKFPRPAVLDFLLRQSRQPDGHALLGMVEHTLIRMYCGGLYDHVGGGFARYSVDAQWLVPHFEKMLYDNAQLVCTYVETWQATGDPLHTRIATDVLGYLLREMSDPAGGFYSATDADSADEHGHLHEGLFFTWTPEEIDEVLDPADARWVRATFGVHPGGNFEGRSILHLDEPLDDDDQARWERVRWALYEARAARPAPGLDDKVLAAWNGLAISAFARAGLAFGERAFVERAEKCADFVLGAMFDGDRLLRSWRGGQAKHPAVLEDYAAVIGGLLDLLEATGDVRRLDQALALQRVLDGHFADPEGGYFRTADDAEALLFREKPAYDGAEPSGNSLAALNLLRLAELTGEVHFHEAALGCLRAGAALADRAPHAVPKLLCAADWLHDRVLQVVVVTEGDTWPADLVAAVARRFVPNKVLLVGTAEGELAARLPLFAGRTPHEGRPTAYVCVGTACRLPATDPQAVAEEVENLSAGSR